MIRLAIVASTIWLQGCVLQALDWVTPETGYQLEKDKRYGHHARHKLDIYHPSAATTRKPVTLVFFYGGAWQAGDKHLYRFVGQTLASHGFTVAIPDYRVYPTVFFPEFIEDGAVALQAIHKYTQQPLVLMGHSAGAHIAAMLALNHQYRQAAGFEGQLLGWIGLSGPYDFLPLEEEVYKTIFSPAEHLAETQPIHYVDESMLPALLLHGLKDTLVSPQNTRYLANRMRAKGNTITERLYPHINHGGTIGGLSIIFRNKRPILSDILAFLSGITLGAALNQH